MNLSEIITGKDLTATFNPGGGSLAFSTLGRVKIDNRSVKTPIAASNLKGGLDRSQGVRELAGYIWDYGDAPPLYTPTSDNNAIKYGSSRPIFPNDLLDLAFTIDKAKAVQIASSGTGVRFRGLEVVVSPAVDGEESNVFYILHIGGAGTDFTATATIPNDGTAPVILPVKSLGVKLAYYNASTHSLVWSPVCYFAGMHLKITADSDPDSSSCLNGVSYHPAGNIDWSLMLGKRVSQWPIPTSPAAVPPMLTGQAAPSVPNTNPGSANSAGDLVYPDLDSVVGIQMATRLNADLTFNSYWQMLYGILGQKSGEFRSKSTKAQVVEYTFDKCSSMASRTGDTGWDAGSVVYSYNNGAATYTLWP